MKKIKLLLLVLFFVTITFSCEDDDNSATRSTESIEVILDNGTPEYFSNNIIAKDDPLPASSGFSCIFNFSSEDTSRAIFRINFARIIDSCPFVQTTPFSNTISGPISYFLEIPGVNFDDSAANSLNINITNFGNNTGDAIDMTISGTYYVVADTNPHSIAITIDILRD